MARVLRDVAERQVAAPERDPEDDRRDEDGREGRDERVLGRKRKPAPPLPGRERAGDERVDDQPEGEQERGAPEGGHQLLDDFAGAYFDGHLVTSDPGFATKTPLRSVPSTTT
jgi:hypothetical protein